MNKTGTIIIIIIIAAIIGTIFLLGRDGTENGSSDEIDESEVTLGVPANNISPTAQEAGSTIVVEFVLLGQAGYLVVHKAVDGAPGDVIGNSDLLPEGSSQNVTVELSEEVVDDQEIILMLHTDNGDGVYEFPGEDTPTQDATGKIILAKITIGAPAEENEVNTTDEMIIEDGSDTEEGVMEDTSTGSEEETTQTETITEITYTNSGFNPNEVTISSGNTVTWTNESGRPMWVASVIHPTHTLYPEKSSNDCLGSSFDACRGVAIGGTYSFTFSEVGNWGYHDHLAAGRRGNVIVE